MLRGAGRAIPIALLLTLAVAACGAPRYTYVKNSGQRTYFKIPSSWHKIDGDALAKVILGNPDSAATQVEKQLFWYVAYDADPHPSISHLTSPIPSDKPFVVAIVQPLTSTEQGMVSLDALRNLGAPVTPAARKQAADAGQGDDNFEWLKDQVLTPGQGLRGVREIYNESAADPTDPTALVTTDRVALASDDGHLYRLIIRCSAHCYKQDKSELDDIASSFTVRKL